MSTLLNNGVSFVDGIRAARRRAKGAPNSSHTSPIAPTATCCSCSLWFFVLLFPHDENCAFIFQLLHQFACFRRA